MSIVPHTLKLASNIYAITSLIVANLVPLYGALYLDWNVFNIMLLYWCESAIIGFFTIKKMSLAEGGDSKDANFGAKVFLIPFFLTHYGLFMFVHLIFLLAFFFQSNISWSGFGFALASLCLSHYISFRTNFIDNQEYKRLTADSLFIKPYPRIIIMHLTIIFGGAIALSTGQSKLALALMVILKIIVDVASHLWEHSQFGLKKISLHS